MISEFLARFIVLFSAITVHEVSHGYAAYKLGDPTAKYQGRLTFNPLAHLDPIGALCMIFFRFGWAKPVPINPMYFRNRKRDTAITAVAGPIANVVLAFAATLLLAPFVVFIMPYFNNILTRFIYTVFVECAQVNICFAVFNLIPIPPLDGSKILGAFMSNENYMRLLTYERYGFPILILLSVTRVLEKVLFVFVNPVYNLWYRVLYGLISILS